MLNQVLPSLLERAILFLSISFAMFAFATLSLRPACVDPQSRARAIRYVHASAWLSGLSIASALCFVSLHFLFE